MRQIAICAALMVVALFVYWPLTNAHFVSWDDIKIVLQNPALTEPFWKRWVHANEGMYMPMTQSAYQLMAVLGVHPGGVDETHYNPHVFHWVLLIVRLLNIPIVFLFLRRAVRDDWAAGAGAALMALHPIGDEAVAWITEISTPLCTLFAAACLWQWLVFRQETRHRRWHYAAALLLYVLSLLSKPQCVLVPVMVWAVDIWIARVHWKRSLRDLWPWLIPAIGISIWMKYLQLPLSGVWVPPLWQRPSVAVDAVAFYLGKLLIPVNFAIDYGRMPLWVLHQHAMLCGEWIAIGLLAWGIWLLRRRRPVFVAAAIIFFAGLVPVLGLNTFWFQALSTTADRYVYLSLIGIALIAADLLAGVRRIWAWSLVVVVLVILSGLSFHQEQFWQDSQQLYVHEVWVHPHGWLGWDNQAFMLIADDHPNQAMPLARVAFTLDSTETDIYSNIGMVLAERGDPRQAIPYFRRMIYSKPKDPNTSMNLGAAYVELHQYDLGISWLRYAHTLNPSSKKIQWLLKGALEMRQRATATSKPTVPHS
ncbi:MAG TPA: tetratricopeptide repeat protein [Tepidisphaeraceae bacterium]|jgi:hypothetical protein